MAQNNELELAVTAAILARIESQVTGIQAYSDLIPPEQHLPAARFSVLDAYDVRSAADPSTTRIFTHFDTVACLQFRSNSISSGMVAQVDALIAALDGYAVNDTPLNVRILSCIREAPWRQTQIIDNEWYRAYGGTFHIIAHSAD